VSSFGFLVADHLPGPFHLELDSIALTNLDHRYPSDDPFLTRHVVRTTKRKDQRDSLQNNFGVGFDMGDGMIEAAEDRWKPRFKNLRADRVMDNHWKICEKAERAQ